MKLQLPSYFPTLLEWHIYTFSQNIQRGEAGSLKQPPYPFTIFIAFHPFYIKNVAVIEKG